MHTVGLLERLKYINRGVQPPRNADSRFDWDPDGLRQQYGLSTAERTVDFLNLMIHGGDILENQRELAIEAFSAAPFADRVSATAAFLLSLPQFQKQ